MRLTTSVSENSKKSLIEGSANNASLADDALATGPRNTRIEASLGQHKFLRFIQNLMLCRYCCTYVLKSKKKKTNISGVFRGGRGWKAISLKQGQEALFKQNQNFSAAADSPHSPNAYCRPINVYARSCFILSLTMQL